MAPCFFQEPDDDQAMVEDQDADLPIQRGRDWQVTKILPGHGASGHGDQGLCFSSAGDRLSSAGTTVVRHVSMRKMPSVWTGERGRGCRPCAESRHGIVPAQAGMDQRLAPRSPEAPARNSDAPILLRWERSG